MVEVINNKVKFVKILKKQAFRRQDAPTTYDLNASIYIWKRKTLLENDFIFTDHTSLFIMPEERSVDIDTQMDWDFVEFITKKELERND